MLAIKKARIEQNKSQNALAREAGMHPSTISLIENGSMKPYPGQADRLAKALDWKESPDSLFAEVEQ